MPLPIPKKARRAFLLGCVLAAICPTLSAAAPHGMAYALSAASEDNVSAQFSPGAGSMLSDAESIVLSISGAETLNDTEAQFTYISGKKQITETVTADDGLAVTDEADGTKTVTVPLSDEVREGVNVELVLSACLSDDGTTNEWSAQYNTLALTLVEPTVTTRECFDEGDSVIVCTNMNDKVKRMTFVIADNETAEQVKTTSYITYNETNDRFEYEFPRAVTLSEGHTYSLTVTAGGTESSLNAVNYGEYTLATLTGLAGEYEYSTYSLTGIDPDPDTTILSDISQNAFTFSFDGPVNINSSSSFVIYGQGVTYKFASYTPADEGEEYSSEWTLTVSTSFMSKLGGHQLTMTVAATDEEGRRVEGNNGEDEETCFSLSYETTIGMPEPTLNPYDGEDIDVLYEIDLDYGYGLNISWLVDESDIKVYDEEGNEVTCVGEAYQYIPDSQRESLTYQPTNITLILNETVETPGNYTLVIPANFFLMVDSDGNVLNKEITATYIVLGTDAVESVTMPDTPNIYKVYKLDGTHVTDTHDGNALKRLAKGIYIVNGKKMVVGRTP